MNSKTKFITKPFNDLGIFELYRIYKLRSEVFVVEQKCAYQDVDEKDLLCYHIMVFEGEELVGYCRSIPPGVSYTQAAIGRVTVTQALRNKGLGKELMEYSIKKTLELFGVKEIVISAQCYLNLFYSDLGFVAEGKEYLEDDIPHIKMRYFMK
jgi:ElaA protein